MKQLILYILTISLIVGCQPPGTEKTVTIENKYSVTIPSFLTEVHNLNEDASLQYQHAWKEFYVIVIDEHKDEFNKVLVENQLTECYSNDLIGYSDLCLDIFKQGISISSKSDLIDKRINNLPARLITIKGKVEDINAFYSVAYIKGQERYYQIITWTLASKEMLYKEQMQKLINSFKEL